MYPCYALIHTELQSVANPIRPLELILWEQFFTREQYKPPTQISAPWQNGVGSVKTRRATGIEWF